MSELTPCCHCSLEALKRKHGGRLLLLADDGWISAFVLDGVPLADQDPGDFQGRPIQWVGSFLALTDHCVC